MNIQQHFANFTIGTIVSIFFCSCASVPTVEPTFKTYSREDLKKGEISLPPNYSSENYRKLQMAVDFSKMSYKDEPLSPDMADALKIRLQTEMAKLKRFTVFSIHNRGGVKLVQSLEDIGEAKTAKPVDIKNIDIVLSGSLIVSKERESGSRKQLLTYEVECDLNCEDLRTRTVKFSEKSKGRTRKTQILSSTGIPIGGFQANSRDAELQVMTNAAVKALAVVANKLGNTFPVGGKITGMIGNNFTMDKGFEHGVGGKMQMVIYTNVSGVDIPLGIAEAQPGQTSSRLVMWRWNDSDEVAEDIIKEMRKEKNWINTHDVLAVGYGMARPADWDKEYKDDIEE